MCGHQWESGRKNENIVDRFYKSSSVFAEIYSEPCKTSKMETFKNSYKNAFWMCLCIVSTGVAFLTYILYIYIYIFKQNLSRRQNLIKCKEYNECKRNQKAFLTQSDKSVEQRLNLRRS